MPTIFLLLSGLGLIPFVFFGLGALDNDPLVAGRMLVGLIDYGALILTFVGAVHWGMALSPRGTPGGPLGGTTIPARFGVRFGAGVVPLIIAWMVLILTQMVSPWIALTTLCIGTVLTVLMEHRAAKHWLIPGNYMALRWVISTVGLIMMLLAIVFKAFGQTIVF